MENYPLTPSRVSVVKTSGNPLITKRLFVQATVLKGTVP